MSAADNPGGAAAFPSSSSAEKPLSPKEFAFEFERLTEFPISTRWVQHGCQRGDIQTVFGSFGRYLIPRSELSRLAAELLGPAALEASA